MSAEPGYFLLTIMMDGSTTPVWSEIIAPDDCPELAAVVDHVPPRAWSEVQMPMRGPHEIRLALMRVT